jgi:hypothetical protein
VKNSKARKRTKAPRRDADYAAARAAGRRPSYFGLGDGGDVIYLRDLRTVLDSALQYGWSISAIKAYAWCYWRNPDRFDHVTASAWRFALDAIAEEHIAGPHALSRPSAFLERFNANPDAWMHVK